MSSEDKVTYTFTNAIPANLEDKRYARVIELFYDVLAPFLKTEKNVVDDLREGKASPQEILAKLGPVITAIGERIQDFIAKGESTNAKCEPIEDHHIMCIINKDVAEILPPDIIDMIMSLLLPNYYLIETFSTALDFIAPLSQKATARIIPLPGETLSMEELAKTLKKQGAYLCKYCGMVFYSPQALGGHMKIHKGEKHGKEERTV